MALNFKLNPMTAVDPATDLMSRQWLGWSPDLSDQQVYDQNRGVWVLGPRARQERLATFSADGTVRVIVRIERLEDIPGKRPGERGRRAIIGSVLTAGDPDYDSLIGTPVDGHRNPVTYIDEPAGGGRTCGCGCGATVAERRAFLPGHDQRAIHERISRQWGSTLAFVDWFDATYESAS